MRWGSGAAIVPSSSAVRSALRADARPHGREVRGGTVTHRHQRQLLDVIAGQTVGVPVPVARTDASHSGHSELT
jgi:hypothetical protein